MEIVIEFNDPDLYSDIRQCGREYCNIMNKLVETFNYNKNLINDIINERIEEDFILIFFTNNLIGNLIKEHYLIPNSGIVNIEDFTETSNIAKSVFSKEKIKIITNDEFKKILNYIDIGYCKYLVIDVTKNYFTSKIY